jgi:glucose uptake protein GlcU
MIWILPLIGLIFFEMIADIFAKEYSLRGGWFWFISLACYIIGNSFWLYSIRHGSGLARGADIFAVSTAILATFIGVYYFNENLRALQMIGIAFGIVSLVLIFWKQ